MKFDQISRPWFNERLSDESKMEELANSIDSMLKPTFIVAELKIKRQELDLFKKEKIVNADNIGSKGWLKLNFFEYIWLKLVLKLREYNIPITAIQKLKQEFFEITDEDLNKLIFQSFNQLNDSKGQSNYLTEFTNEITLNGIPPAMLSFFKKRFPNFNLFILGIIIEREPVNLLINNAGDTCNFFLNKMEDSISDFDVQKIMQSTYLSIPMHTLLDEFYTVAKIIPTEQQEIFKLTKLETKVLGLLKKENIKEIRIRFNQQLRGDIIIESVNYANPDLLIKNIHDILERGKYSTIKIVQEDGHLKIFEEVVREKIRNIN
jgi:hypothetical protein